MKYLEKDLSHLKISLISKFPISFLTNSTGNLFFTHKTQRHILALLSKKYNNKPLEVISFVYFYATVR